MAIDLVPSPQSVPRVRLRLLDGFEFEQDGARVELPLGTQRLVAFLAFHERPLLRTYVAGCLWLDSSSERSYANLRTALWRLRRPAMGLIECRGQHLLLATEVDIDLRHVVRLAHAPLDDGADPSETTHVLLTGDLLPDWYDDWVVVERERLRQLRLHALEAHCLRLARCGRFCEAVEVGLAAVSAEPLRESAHRALILAHLAEGNMIEAARQYVRFRDLAWEALGVEPSRALTAQLADAIDLDLVDSWGAGRSA